MATKECDPVTSLSVRCAICLDTLNVPKALPCLHTFCLHCLQRHIAVTVRNRGDKITCPECRMKCSPPDSTKPVSEWAGRFPTNFHLLNLLDAPLVHAATGTVNSVCGTVNSVCGTVNSVCGTVNSVCGTVNCTGGCMHKGVNDQGGREQGEQSSNSGGLNDDFARRLKEARSSVDNRLLELGAEMQHLSMVRAEVTTAWKKSKEAASEAFAYIMAAVKARQETLLTKLDADYVECTQRLCDREERKSVKMDQLRRCSSVITDVMTGEGQSEGQGHDYGLDSVEKRLRELNQDIDNDADDALPLNETLVLETEDVASVIRSVEDLGTFRTAAAGVGDVIPSITNRVSQTVRSLSPDLHRSTVTGTPRGGQPPVYLTHIHLKSPGDKKEPFVTGVCCFSGVLLLTDVNNRSVKGVYFTRQGDRGIRLQDLFLRSDPLCITAIPAQRQAIVGSECCLYVLTFDQRLRISVKQTIRLKKCYYGIAALPEGQRVAACSDQPPSVDIIDLQACQVTKTISKDSVGNNLFISPFYLTAMPEGRLLVSDKDNTLHPVTCISSEGTVIYRYNSPSQSTARASPSSNPKMVWPLGVSSTTGGDALVVDASLHAVFRLSGEGTVVEKLMEDASRLSSPSALCFDQRSRRMYVVGNKGSELLVYDFCG